MHQKALNCTSLPPSLSFSSVRQKQPIAMATEADVRGFSCVMRCELLTFTFKKKERNGSNGYRFMSVCAAATFPLTQLGTPYATVCIFYDVGLCRGSTTHGLLGFADTHCMLNLYNMNCTLTSI